MYKLDKNSTYLRDAFQRQHDEDRNAFLQQIAAQQVAVAVMCGDGWIARHHAEQPGSAYIDTRVGGLPYSRHAIGEATAILVMMAEIAGLDPNKMPAVPRFYGASNTGGHLEEAKETAAEAIREHIDDIISSITELSEVTDDPLGDVNGLERFVDETAGQQGYGLADAVAVLDDLNDYVETDAGLWEGMEPGEAIEAQATFTYTNAVRSLVGELFNTLREDDTITELIAAYDANEDDFSGEDGSPNSAYESTKEHILTTLKARILEVIE